MLHSPSANFSEEIFDKGFDKCFDIASERFGFAVPENKRNSFDFSESGG
jgi:hypothetical protein